MPHLKNWSFAALVIFSQALSEAVACADDETDWIFYNGVPKTGTSSLRKVILGADFVKVLDVTAWGCSSAVGEHWVGARRNCDPSKLPRIEQSTRSGCWADNTSSTSEGCTSPSLPANAVFMTGHACFVAYAAPVISLNTVREPLDRWVSAFEYMMHGSRALSQQQHFKAAVNRYIGRPANATEHVDFGDCLDAPACVEHVVKTTSLNPARAFTPCDACSVAMHNWPLHHSDLVVMADVIMRYDLVLPLEAFGAGLAVLAHIAPPRFAPALKAGSEIHARKTNNNLTLTASQLTKTQLDIVESLERASGERFLYNVAKAAFCAKLASYDDVTPPPLCEEATAFADRRRYLVVVGEGGSGLLRGGLHNQFMALGAIIELADALNRTLVLPFATASHPKLNRGSGPVAVDLADVYSLSSLARSHPLRGVDSTWIVPLSGVPGAAFLNRADADLAPGPSHYDAAPLLLRADADLLVAHQQQKQAMFSGTWVLKDPAALRLVGEPLRLFRRCLCFIITGGSATDDDCEAAPPKFVAIHLRVEGDFFRYAKSHAAARGEPFDAFYRYPAEVQAAFAASSRLNTSNLLFLAYSHADLPSKVEVPTKGWPAGVRVVTNRDLEHILDGASYFVRSAVVREVCLVASSFVGNTHSSFTRAIIERTTGATFVYNCRRPKNDNFITECANGNCCDHLNTHPY